MEKMLPNSRNVKKFMYFLKKNEKKEKNDVPQNVSCLNSTFLLIKLVKNHTTAMITLDELDFFLYEKIEKKLKFLAFFQICVTIKLISTKNLTQDSKILLE